MVDSLTKFVILEAVENTSAAGVIKFLKKTFLTYGNPDVLISDRGTAYTAESVEQFLRENGVKHSLISTQHAQANGAVERINKEVARMLRSLCEKEDGSDWAQQVLRAQVYLNRFVNRTTGKAPFEALYGYLPRFDNFSQIVEGEQSRIWNPPQALQAEIRDNIAASQNKYAFYYNKKRRPHVVKYQLGDVVAVSRLPVYTGQPVKLQPKFRGPMIITEILPSDTYRLVQLGEKKYSCTAHCSQLRWFRVHAENDDEAEPIELRDYDDGETTTIEPPEELEEMLPIEHPSAVRESTRLNVSNESTENEKLKQPWREKQDSEEVESSPSFGERTTVGGGSDSASSSAEGADQEKNNEIVNQGTVGSSMPKRKNRELAALDADNIIRGKILRTPRLNRVGQKYTK